MRQVDDRAKVEMWVSEFETHIDGEYVWEWAVYRYSGVTRQMEEFAYGKEPSRMFAEYEATKVFEFCGGSI